ncbi:MAG TPA: dihydroorotate dehydrogenase electron transfer subunit [Terriglobia bacterium]|nr:dihydroorotate dehydrogenase electron transfer subunit [Terriglobia bacterium]
MYDETVAVVENRPLTGGHFLLSVHSPRQAQATRPGQFAMVQLLGRSDVVLRRPMSIYDVKPAHAWERKVAPPGRAALAGLKPGATGTDHSLAIIQLLYKIVGRGTRLMAGLKPGDRVGLLAPLGHGFLAEEYLGHAQEAEEVLHVAGGIGIAALLLPARELARAGIRQRLFFGGRSKDDLVGLDEFKPLVKSMVLATENGARGHGGYVTQPLETFLERNRHKKYLMMVCGPWAMLEASVKLAHRFCHRCLLSMENRMGCGVGVCLGCCIRVQGTGHSAYQRVCTEGPVFWSEKVIWEKENIAKT